MREYVSRSAVVAGQFYPAERDRLQAVVARYMEAPAIKPAPEAVAALVCPHAGYPYSGPTAGYAYARVHGKKVNRVVLMGCSHQVPITTASLWSAGAFETPLGAFPIDETVVGQLTAQTGSESMESHLFEHALEVQLPFLYEAIGPVPIVPILFGSTITSWHIDFGKTLARLLDKNDLVVASTDLSHYYSESQAYRMDVLALDTLLKRDIRKFIHGIDSGAYALCGAAAVVVTMAYAMAKGATSWSMLDYRTSARVSGDTSRVVGYAAVSMEYE